MSWIIKDLWKTLEERRQEYETLLNQAMPQAFSIINEIASEVGARHGVFIQANLPPGRGLPSVKEAGHRDLTILVYHDRKKFQGITEQELRNAFQPLRPSSFENTGYGYEGFRVEVPSGRIDCLPGGVHLWAEITPDVLRFIDWLFDHGYQIKQLAKKTARSF